MTVVMKIDLAGPRRRGLALGLNEAAGYLGVAATAFATGALAASFAPRTIVWAGRRACDRGPVGQHLLRPRHRRARRARAGRPWRRVADGASISAPRSRARVCATRCCAPASQAGLVNNLNDALAWGLAPLYLAAHGASSVRQIAVVAAAYPPSGAPASS